MKPYDMAALIAEDVSSPVSTGILAGEIEGLRTVVHRVPAMNAMALLPDQNAARVLVFLDGAAAVEYGNREFYVTETAVLAATPDAGVVVSCTAGCASFLELVVSLHDEDRAAFEEYADHYPVFITYSECATYKEAIKSEKTVNRTLLPEYTFPRLCIGSVQTTGPDEVGRHEHPMLEQLFLGLAGNDCIVTADDAETALGELEILHIPLGSRHGARVDPGRDLHYIWIDLFKEISGMDYIAETHDTGE